MLIVEILALPFLHFVPSADALIRTRGLTAICELPRGVKIQTLKLRQIQQLLKCQFSVLTALDVHLLYLGFTHVRQQQLFQKKKVAPLFLKCLVLGATESLVTITGGCVLTAASHRTPLAPSTLRVVESSVVHLGVVPWTIHLPTERLPELALNWFDLVGVGKPCLLYY